MDIKRFILLAFALALAGVGVFIAGFLTGTDRADKPTGAVQQTRETYYDTIPYIAPVPKSESVAGTLRYYLPAYRIIGTGAGGEPRQRPQQTGGATVVGKDTTESPVYCTDAGGVPRCSPDSVIVELPKIQRHYADSTYEAWVSGPIDPRLDSVRVRVPTTIITQREWKPPKRWHIGVTAGYGYGPQGFQPFIGFGVTYSIFSL